MGIDSTLVAYQVALYAYAGAVDLQNPATILQMVSFVLWLCAVKARRCEIHVNISGYKKHTFFMAVSAYTTQTESTLPAGGWTPIEHRHWIASERHIFPSKCACSE